MGLGTRPHPSHAPCGQQPDWTTITRTIFTVQSTYLLDDQAFPPNHQVKDQSLRRDLSRACGCQPPHGMDENAEGVGWGEWSPHRPSCSVPPCPTPYPPSQDTTPQLALFPFLLLPPDRIIPPHLAQGTQHSQADPCPASLQFGVLVFLGPQKSPPGLVWGPHRATLLIFKGLSFPQQRAWPRPGPGERARATPRAPLLLVLWSRLSLSLSAFLLWTQDTGSLKLLCGKKSSEGQKTLESSFSGWPWTSHFISQNPFCKHGCVLPCNLVRRHPALSESIIFFMTGRQGWRRGSTLRGPPVTGRAWLSPRAQTGCRHRQVLPGGLLC